MNNVVRLFEDKLAETVLLEREARIGSAVTSFLVSSEQLGRTANELSKNFDTIESVVQAIGDTETRKRLEESTRLSRETLSRAILKLTRQIGQIVVSRGV